MDTKTHELSNGYNLTNPPRKGPSTLENTMTDAPLAALYWAGWFLTSCTC